MNETLSTEEFVKLPVDEARNEYLRLRETGQNERAEALRREYWAANKVSVMMGASEVTMKPLGASTGTVAAGFNPGWLMFWVGLALALGSFVYDPSVSTSSAYSSDLFSVPDRVVNNGKLNIQLMLCMFGSALMVSGSVLVARR